MKRFCGLLSCCSNNSVDNISLGSLTYGVNRYMKNSMLMFCQITGEVGCRNMELTFKDVKILKKTFQKYRFEIETYIDLTSSEIEDTCNKFFARDFTGYGAIAVVVLSPNGGPDNLAASDQMFHEHAIIKHFKFETARESLKYKPKLYITEAHRTEATAGDIARHLSFNDEYRHVQGFHLPLIIHGAPRSPLQIFCDRMNSPKPTDYDNVIRIIDGAVKEMEDTFPSLQGKIVKVCTTICPFTLPSIGAVE